MRLSDFKNDFYYFSGKASDVARHLAFAGIALVWIFKKEKAGSFELPDDLKWSLIFLIGALVADLLQYVAGSIIWQQFHRYHEKRRDLKNKDPELEAPYYFPYPIILFFWLKIFCVIVAYFVLLSFSISSINFV